MFIQGITVYCLITVSGAAWTRRGCKSWCWMGERRSSSCGRRSRCCGSAHGNRRSNPWSSPLHVRRRRDLLHSSPSDAPLSTCTTPSTLITSTKSPPQMSKGSRTLYPQGSCQTHACAQAWTYNQVPGHAVMRLHPTCTSTETPPSTRCRNRNGSSPTSRSLLIPNPTLWSGLAAVTDSTGTESRFMRVSSSSRLPSLRSPYHHQNIQKTAYPHVNI